METTPFDGGQNPTPAYDYRMYDRVWQRVAPGTDPFSQEPDAGMTVPETSPAPVPQTAAPVPAQEGGEGNLPGAEPNPCCMGTEAKESLEVLESFLQEEMAESRCCQALSCRVGNREAARLLRRAASEKRAAARELCAAYYLTTGSRYTSAVTVERLCWENLPQALRACYHQEACNGFNYQRASEEAEDICLQKLFARLGEQSYSRAEALMALLGRIVC